MSRSLYFASDDEDALAFWEALSGALTPTMTNGSVAEPDARDVYRVLQSGDLHNLGGPPW